MSIEIIPINGTSDFFNFEVFVESVKNVIEKQCTNAKIFLFNNCPIPFSVETNIDLILVIAIEDKINNFYIPKNINGKPIYFHNQIIPIKFVTQYYGGSFLIENNNVIKSDEEYIDYSYEIQSIKFSLLRYLSEKCGFIGKDLFIQPLIFIQGKNELFLNNYIVSESFDFNVLDKYFLSISSDIFISYKRWKFDVGGYNKIDFDIERLANQASKDSKIGYLTKRKIKRITKQLSKSRIIFEELNKNLIIIKGKAGSGKSSELILLTIKCINNGKNTLFLTYNNLLIFDITLTIKAYLNQRSNNLNAIKPGESSVLTLHKFFFRLSKSLGVLHILKSERINQLLSDLKTKMNKIFKVIEIEYNNNNIDFNLIKSVIQNHKSFDIGTKELGIDFVSFLKKRNIYNSSKFKNAAIDFFNHKKQILGNIEASNIFLSDYYGVLENTLFQLNNPEEYYEKYNIEDKYEILDIIIGPTKKYQGEKDGKVIITLKGFLEFKNRHTGGYKRKRTLFIDEAQDCHRLEKDILISIFGSNEIVVANGGKEQLIRHVELCNWEVSKSKKLNISKYDRYNKSYRVKKTIVDFCNYVADKFQIDLNLEPLEMEDEGELLIDFRQSHSKNEILEIFNYLNLKGKVNGCTPYESLLILLESNTQREGITSLKEEITDSAIINEYGNIEEGLHLKRGTWKYIKALNEDGFMFWDGTQENKTELIIPCSNESRVIYYESCRGLEAWTVSCFSLDKFFNQKREDPDAERYLIEELQLYQNNEQRKSMYAATWALMALTRSIDTMYIQINDKNSEFGSVVLEYLNLKKKNVRELGKGTILF